MMETKETKYSRSYLEALSFSDLLHAADSCGIDVPENLNRNFLIAEILESDLDNEAEDEMSVALSDDLSEKKLPDMYNVTEVKIILQNPVWAFVFWNVSDSDLQYLKKQDGFSFFLRVCSFEKSDGSTPVDSFEVKISIDSREQYVLLPSESEFVAVELYACALRNDTRLAVSQIVRRPRSSILKQASKPGGSYKLDDVMELSGTNKLLRKHYINYRQLFS